jgi:phosphatidylserine decarboxylase
VLLKNMLSRYGLREILILTGTAGVSGVLAAMAAVHFTAWYWLIAAPLLLAWLGGLAFFRDPSRTIPDGPGALVAPADGKVTEISTLDRLGDFNGPALRIGIFLSIFDVHVNRSPCTGKILSIAYERGEFLDARHPESGHRNEANTIIIAPEDGSPGPIIVRQIAGLIARRIVCPLKVGDRVERGQRIGMLKFGSRTELIVRSGVGFAPAVELGEHVSGASTTIMTFNVGGEARSASARGAELGGAPSAARKTG